MPKVKRVLAIHDICGIGRCSLSVALPILSVLGVKCCPLPTAWLSSPTNFDKFTFCDLTGEMYPALNHWKSIGYRFDAIYSGFMASERQMDTVAAAKKLFPKAVLIVDPVMGDHGKTYQTYTPVMCDRMRSLSDVADIIIPNLTEASIILGRDYETRPRTENEAMEWLRSLSKNGSRSVVLTGIFLEDDKVSTGWQDAKTGACGLHAFSFMGRAYHGTGDVFASVLTGLLVNGSNLSDSARSAARFVRDCAESTFTQDIPPDEGVQFEPLLANYRW